MFDLIATAAPIDFDTWKLVRIARLVKPACSSGASSGSSVSGLPKYFAPALFLFVMAVPHRNNVPVDAALRPHHRGHSAVKETGADVANIAIIVAAQLANPLTFTHYSRITGVGGNSCRRFDPEHFSLVSCFRP